jgi:hypothetical protein
MYQASISLRLKTKFLPLQPQLSTTLWVISLSQFASIVFGPELHPQSALKRNMFFIRKSFHSDQLGACSLSVLLVLDWLLCLPTSCFATYTKFSYKSWKLNMPTQPWNFPRSIINTTYHQGSKKVSKHQMFQFWERLRILKLCHFNEDLREGPSRILCLEVVGSSYKSSGYDESIRVCNEF